MDNTNYIKEIIHSKGLSVNELAERLGITRVTLSTQINGTANIKSYGKIADALGVPLWQIFANPDEVCGKPKKELNAMIEFRGKLYTPCSIDELEQLITSWKNGGE